MDKLSSRLDTPEEKILNAWRNMRNNTHSVIPFVERPKRDTSKLNCLEMNT